MNIIQLIIVLRIFWSSGITIQNSWLEFQFMCIQEVQYIIIQYVTTV